MEKDIKKDSICSKPECNNKHKAKGLCQKHYKQAHYIKNKTKYNQSSKTWAQRNPERKRELDRKSDKKNRPYIVLYQYIRYHTDPEYRRRRLEKDKKYRDNNVKKYKERNKKYREKNKEILKLKRECGYYGCK